MTSNHELSPSLTPDKLEKVDFINDLLNIMLSMTRELDRKKMVILIGEEAAVRVFGKIKEDDKQS